MVRLEDDNQARSLAQASEQGELLRFKVLLEKSGSEVHRLRGLLGDMERQASEVRAES